MTIMGLTGLRDSHVCILALIFSLKMPQKNLRTKVAKKVAKSENKSALLDGTQPAGSVLIASESWI